MSEITYKQKRLTVEQYIEFLTRTNLDSQYPKERFEQRIPKLVKNVSINLIARDGEKIAGGEKDIAVYLIANENAIPFYEKPGMKLATDVMQYNHIDWTEFTVGEN